MDKPYQDLKWFERPIFINTILLTVTTSLFVFKIILGFLLNSLALQADALDNLTDVIFIITGLIGCFLTRRLNITKPGFQF